LVERHVYTVEVGGSSPSPPTTCIAQIRMRPTLAVEPCCEENVARGGTLSRETPMSRKFIFVLVALSTLSSVAIVLAIARTDLTYPTRADFDRTFAASVTNSTFDLERTAADREKIRMVVLKR
jgi:hypothetical protein